MRIQWHGGPTRKPSRGSMAVHVGRQLAALRERDQLTMHAVHERTGLSNAFICQVENGQSLPTVETLWKLAACFGVDLNYFVDGYQAAMEGDEPCKRNQRRKRTPRRK